MADPSSVCPPDSIKETSTRSTDSRIRPTTEVSFVLPLSFLDLEDLSPKSILPRSTVHFPLLKGNVRSKSSSGLRLVSVDSEVSAFQLTLDSALPSYVFALIDVYEQGKKRLDRLAVEHNFEQFYGQGTQVVDDHGPSISRKKSLEVQATFEFNAGHVSLFSYSDAEDLRGGLDGTPASKKPRDPEVFVLPTVSMWCEYHDKVASTSSPSSSSSLPEVTTGPALLVNTTVHGTSNSISPDVLPFFVQIMHTIDHRPPKFDPPSPESRPARA